MNHPTTQLTLPLGSDPITTLASYIGPSVLALEDAARDFLCFGRVLIHSDVPDRVLIEAAAAIWTAEELAELRALQAALRAMERPEDESRWPDYDRAWLDAWRAESLCCARLIRRVAPRWADYWERGWR